jgi:hypothetical protein
MASRIQKDARNFSPVQAVCLRLGGHDRASRSGIRRLSPVLTGWRSAGELAERRAIQLREAKADR